MEQHGSSFIDVHFSAAEVIKCGSQEPSPAKRPNECRVFIACVELLYTIAEENYNFKLRIIEEHRCIVWAQSNIETICFQMHICQLKHDNANSLRMLFV